MKNIDKIVDNDHRQPVSKTWTSNSGDEIDGFDISDFTVGNRYYLIVTSPDFPSRHRATSFIYGEVTTLGLDINPSKATLIPGLQSAMPQQLDVTYNPVDATNRELRWSSSDPSVATVDANGLVTPVAPGTATITAYLATNLQIFDISLITVAEPSGRIHTDQTEYPLGGTVTVAVAINNPAPPDVTINFTLVF